MKRVLSFLTILSVTLLLMSQSAAAKEIVITPFGQSPDGMMIKVVLKKAGFKADLKKALTAGELSDEKVVILVVGGSSKGMGAAGLDKDSEIERIHRVVKKAKTNSKKVLVMHVGGKGRRGKLTDVFLKKSVTLADEVIIVESGNFDGLFTDLTEKNNIPMVAAKSIRKTAAPLKDILTKWGLSSSK